ncbi:MAG: oxidoreductase [Phycisphaerae bacterium]|nr:MAG: oxidoreductase [Phycisphaerae bacterium]
MPNTYLITGANRGLGLEFVKQLAARGDRVLAVVRRAEQRAGLKGLAARVFIADVTDAAGVAALGRDLAGEAVDVLINNAGVSSESATLAKTTPEEMDRVFRVNATSPLLVTRAALPALRAGGRKVVVNISSQLASIANNTGGSSYAYRASKCALNMLTVCLANEFRGEGLAFVAMHPGWVKTDMGGPNAPMQPSDSIGWMVRTIDGVSLADSGKFLNYDGKPLPW